MRRVIIESPYHGDITTNLAYLQECIRDSLRRDESPYASHQMLTTALDDNIQAQRVGGMYAGYSWWPVADAIVFYVDLGWSGGMKLAKDKALKTGMRIEERKIR